MASWTSAKTMKRHGDRSAESAVSRRSSARVVPSTSTSKRAAVGRSRSRSVTGTFPVRRASNRTFSTRSDTVPAVVASRSIESVRRVRPEVHATGRDAAHRRVPVAHGHRDPVAGPAADLEIDARARSSATSRQEVSRSAATAVRLTVSPGRGTRRGRRARSRSRPAARRRARRGTRSTGRRGAPGRRCRGRGSSGRSRSRRAGGRSRAPPRRRGGTRRSRRPPIRIDVGWLASSKKRCPSSPTPTPASTNAPRSEGATAARSIRPSIAASAVVIAKPSVP